MPEKWICPQCGEEALNKRPTSVTPYQRQNGMPEWSHHDGEALCPVMGPDGYLSAEPVRTD